MRIARLGKRSITYAHRFLRDGAELASGEVTAVCCRIKEGTKLTYSSTGGPTTAEVCCQVDYWCDPYRKKGNLPGGIVCCCPGLPGSSKPPICKQPPVVTPPVPPPPPRDKPPLESGAPRKKLKPRCCYGAKRTGLQTTMPSWAWGSDMAATGLAALDRESLYLTGEVYGDCSG